MYKKGTGNDKQGKDAGNRTLCPYRNFSQAINSNNKNFISQNLKVVGPLGGKFDFSVPRDLKFKVTLITEPQKSSSTLSEL